MIYLHFFFSSRCVSGYHCWTGCDYWCYYITCGTNLYGMVRKYNAYTNTNISSLVHLTIELPIKLKVFVLSDFLDALCCSRTEGF